MACYDKSDFESEKDIHYRNCWVLVFMQSLKRIGTVRTIVIFSMASVFGLAFASEFLHEQISAFQLIAIVIMLTGIYLINRKESLKENPESQSFGF